ncbi:hypothetical protein BGW36DRAFT_159072 [Talaromyces proteolyticus]|uniref:Zn(2)-C6 fungal-type domain-containing protein n=1 Tax=Talaromyces proteolyticus TaxID=1131652 RepID=A0AAD4KYA8_9EURO|nr:uncharacterized protein BGW36DRAFT_159072 [Talaromyces proteolyticus]KAH8699307.1 hypothetical protein BGW36DRAFT_159072 [Talaromyces proteolyticus]
MPNVGRPSRDCYACRKRRVKCDLIRPECNQCQRKGLPCPGYRDELDMRFHVESVSSFQSHIGKDRRRTSNQDEGKPSALIDTRFQCAVTGQLKCHPTPADPSPHSSERCYTLQYRLAEPMKDHFMALAMHNFKLSLYLDERIYSTILRVVSKAETGSVLYQACNVIGCSYMANTTMSIEVLSHQPRAYGDAITAINLALHKAGESKTDNTFLGILLLSMYKLFSTGQTTVNSVLGSSEWKVHSSGLIQLTQLRGLENFSTPDKRNLLVIFYNMLLMQAIVTGRPPPKAILVWIQGFYQSCDPSEYPVVRHLIFSYHCSALCSRIRCLLNLGNLEKVLSDSHSILQDMEYLEKETYPLSHENPITDYIIEPPLVLCSDTDPVGQFSIDQYIHQIHIRMRVSHHILEFLSKASRAPYCTPEQRISFTHFQRRGVEELQALASKVSLISATDPDKYSHARLVYIDLYLNPHLSSRIRCRNVLLWQ